MRNYLSIITLVFVSSIAVSQTPTENYVKSTSYQIPTLSGDGVSVDNKIESITYYDGLGRPKQNIVKQAGGQKQDIISPIVYDGFGRQSRQYLPYADSNQPQGSANLNFIVQEILLDSINSKYFAKYPEESWLNIGDVNAYSETIYEQNPLNRVSEQGAPGKYWKIPELENDEKHTVKYDYNSNEENEVPYYKVIFPVGDTKVPSLYYDGYYTSYELYKTITKDENWQPNQTHENDHTTEEFKDKQGRVILKRTYNNEVPHDTQYVYDDYGNLTYVLSPKGSDQILSHQGLKSFNYDILAGKYGASITPKFARKGSGVTTTGTVMVNSYASGDSHYLAIDFDVVFSQPTALKTGAITQLAHYVPDVILGTIQATGGEYIIGVKDQTLYFSGSGTFTSINESLTVELPSYPISNIALEDLCYIYHYDSRNRLIEKKIPGKEWESIVYDKLDRPILTQDALLDAANKWLFTKYDALGRVAYTGITSSTKTRSSMQSTVNNQNTLYETSGSTTIDNVNTYYTNNAYPQSISELHTINYYDTYNDALLDVATNPQTVLEQDVSSETKSLPTGSKVRVLTDAGSHWVTTVNYYDNKARPIYTASHNGYLNTTDRIETELDFTGNVLQTKAYHTKNGTTITVEDTFAYDHASRLLTQEQQVNNQTAETIVSNTYDALGQLITKGVGGSAGSPLQNVDYTYNIRGWLKQINDVENLNDDLFSFQLNYANNASAQSDALFNGNIADALWKTANDNTLYSYNYRYDALNRITNAVFNGGGIDDRYNLAGVSYDKNGNHNGFVRKGPIVSNPNGGTSGHFGVMDDLTNLMYKGNQLLNVSDRASVTVGFIDANNSGIDDDFEYDANGNMILDRNKGISSIAYNHLNLPIEVVFDNNQNKKITYIYDAAGSKHEKQVNDLGNITNTVYAGNYIYENTGSGDALKFFSHPEGYAEPNGFGFDYVYQYKDHLGNIRLSYKDISTNYTPNLQIVEENNYYPFGMKHKGYNNNQVGVDHKYGFQEQEEQDELGLGWVQFKWRNHDPAIGRFMTIDILTEKYMDWGPYVFSGNRLIDARELEGLEPLSVHATMDAAAENFGIYFNGPSIGVNEEYGSTIYEVVTASGIQYAYSVPNIGTGGSSVIPSLAPTGATAVGDIHTHAAYDPAFANNIFSGISSSGSNLSSRTGDIGAFNVLGLIGYITTPNGSLQRYDNISGVISTIGTNMPSDPLDPTRLNTVAPRAPRAPVAPITPVRPNPIVPIPVPTPQPDLIPVITPTPAPLPIIIPTVGPDGGN